jgi:low affinity Fe/Cu permease
VRELFSKFARGVAGLAGHPAAFAAALAGVLTWAALGPRLHYSENWQLWINTVTTILTFLMVFLLQHSQNRDARAVQLKLDELLRAVNGARNELIDLENLSEEELTKYCREFQDLHLRYARVIKKKGQKLEVKAEQASVFRRK